MARPSEINIPNVRLDLEELLAVVQSLDKTARARVAQALAETEIDARFKELIEQLAARSPVDDVTDIEIDREVQAVRGTVRSV